VVQFNLVNRVNRCVGVGVRRQQNTASRRLQGKRLQEKIRATDERHALIDQKQSNSVATGRELPDKPHRLLGRLSRQNPVLRSKLRFKIALDRAQNRWIIVNCENVWLFMGI